MKLAIGELMIDDCLFCKIVNGGVSSYKVWEDASHIAFLSIFPNTDGVTVVIPKNIILVMFFQMMMK